MAFGKRFTIVFALIVLALASAGTVAACDNHQEGAFKIYAPSVQRVSENIYKFNSKLVGEGSYNDGSFQGTTHNGVAGSGTYGNGVVSGTVGARTITGSYGNNKTRITTSNKIGKYEYNTKYYYGKYYQN